MSRGRALPLLAVLALGLGVAGYWSTRVGPDEARREAAAQMPETRPASIAQPAWKAAPPGAQRIHLLPFRPGRMPLPPLDAPLAEVFPALERAARAGDVGAQCRLAVEIERCTRLLEKERRWARIQAERLEELHVDNEASRVAMLARSTAKLDRIEAICTGIDIPADLEPWQLLRSAARSGHVPSMLRFVREFPLTANDLVQRLDILAIYRDEAPGYLQRAATSPDLYGAHAMFWALQGQPGFAWPSFRPVARDPVQLLSYTLALRGFTDDWGTRKLSQVESMLRRKLDGEDERRAEAQAKSLSAMLTPARGTTISMSLNAGSKSGEDCSRP
jgi:hypothetical protein